MTKSRTRSIPKVASAYRLHARVARVLGASWRLRPSLSGLPSLHKNHFPSLEFALPPLCGNPPSFSRNVLRNINDNTKRNTQCSARTNFIIFYMNGSMNKFYFYEIYHDYVRGKEKWKERALNNYGRVY